jgi:hypothetical protein
MTWLPDTKGSSHNRGAVLGPLACPMVYGVVHPLY